MSLYLDFHFDKDFVGCATGGAWIVPKRYSTHDDDGIIRISHDCCTMGELEFVLKELEADIADIRKRAKVAFAKKRERKPIL